MNKKEKSQKIQDIYSLTPLQEGMLYHYNSEPDSTGYILQSVYDIDFELREDMLGNAIKLLAARYDVLRTTILYEKVKTPRQVVLKEKPVECIITDCTECKAEEIPEIVSKIVRKDLLRGFNLQKDSLIRFTYIKCPDKKSKLLFSIHHIIIDGWCNKLLLNKLMEYYSLLVGGVSFDNALKMAAKERAGKSEYKDYINWIQKNDAKKALNYWRNLLDDFQGANKIMPLEKPERCREQNVEISCELDKEVSSQLMSITREMNVTINTVMETLVGILVQKSTGDNDAVMGKVVSGRDANIPGIESIIGLFINAIPLRVNNSDDLTFKTLVMNQNQQAVESSEFSYCSLGEIQNLTVQKRDLINILFVFENYDSFGSSSPASASGGESSIADEYRREQTNYDLTITACSNDTNILVNFDYLTDKYSRSDIQLLIDRLKKICEAVAQNHDIKISDIDCLTDGEKEKILNDFNSNKIDYPKDKTVIDFLEEKAVVMSDRVALKHEDKTVTFKELNYKANCLGNTLRKKGIGTEDLVILIAGRSSEMIEAIYGILKSGAAYVPVDPDVPEDRIKFIVEDCSAKAVVTFGVNLDFDVNAEVLRYEDVAFNDELGENPEKITTSDNIAYIIYTSGTTGKPKGVMIEHKSLANLICVYEKEYGMTEKDIALQFANYCFDQSVWEIFSIVKSGSALCTIPDSYVKDPEKLSEYAEKEAVTVMLMTPTYINLLNAALFKTLRLLDSGGEAGNLDTLKQWQKTGKRVLNTYGPTETTVNASSYKITVESDKMLIGKPMANLQFYVMNGDKLCGIGVPGELCIAGDGVARGYLNRPELTDEKFVKNPFGKGKMYRSGDLARWLPDGNVECLGRIDEQVKIRGLRIELGEIQSRLREISFIDDCAVLVKTDASGEKSIHAYFVSEQAVNIADVKATLGKNLPKYMIPAYMMQIPVIPVTRNGKIDTRALPEISTDTGIEYVKPQTEVQAAICEIFCNILGVKRVGIKDDFFEMGGHSLRATRLINAIETQTGVKIPLNKVFKNTTPEQLAKLVEGDSAKDYVPIPKAEEKEYYPMTSVQKRTYFIQQMDPKSIAYNIPYFTKMKKNADPERIREAFRKIIERHEILRTAFCVVDGEPMQKIYDSAEPDFEYIVSDEEDEKLIADFIRPFDLSRPSAVRMRVVEKKDYCLLQLDIHHIISDGMSTKILTDEFAALYNGEELPPVNRQFKDYSEWMNSRDFSSQARYWQEQFADEVPVLEMPYDYVRPVSQSFDGTMTEGIIDSDLREQIEHISYRTGATEYMILLACFMITLSKYSRQEDIVVGSPVSGRTHSDTEKMLGMFVNTMAMRGKPEGNKRFSDFLSEIKTTCINAYENQEYPFEELIDAINVKRDMSRNPIFDVMFTLQNNESSKAELKDGSAVSGVEFKSSIAKFDLTLNITKAGKLYLVDLEYCTALYKEDTAQRILSHFIETVREAVSDTALTINEINMLSEQERKEILEIFNSESNDYPKDRLIIDDIEEQAEKNPENTAVVFGGESLTYSMFSGRANNIAYKLRAMGVKPDDYVAIIADRSLEMMCAVYGVLKSGGAYVPIDPTYPQERITYMLTDCMPKAVIVFTNENIVLPDSLAAIDLHNAEFKEVAAENPPHVNTADDLAYCIYTSGTTGKPKGVMVEHHGVVNLAGYMKEYLNISENDRVMLFSNYIFDGSVWEMNMAFANGAALYIPDDETVRDISIMEEYVKTNHITVSYFPPAYFEQGNFPLDNCIITAGSQSTKSIAAKASATSTYMNSYEPTEASVCSSNFILKKSESVPDTISIGTPISNVQIYIMTGNNLSGIGVPGELCIAGSGIARGYLNRPELTAEKFVQNPFGKGKMYRSGDLARWLPDGSIEYLGRIDEQVKIRGFRVELGEIESRLKEIDSIRECAVIAKADSTGEKSIYAYYVSGEEVSVSQIREVLGQVLPDYMIPSYMMQIDSIPVTRNGKLDKRALPDIAAKTTDEYEEPQTDKEKAICTAFESVLNVEKAGRKNSFFELGGDSIKAIRIVSKLRSMGYTAAVKDIMTQKTAEKIADYITHETTASRYEQGEVSGKVEKTPIIKIFDNWKFARPEYFNQTTMITVTGYENKVIKNAVEALVKHHDILRGVYRENELQILPVSESKLFDFYEFDYGGQDNLRDIIEKKCEEIQGSIDLENGPLVKIAVFDIGDSKLMMFCIHHLLVDGVSWHILTEDFNAAAEQLARGENAVLPEKTASFIEWSRVLKEYGETMQESEKEFWHEMVSQIPSGIIKVNANEDEENMSASSQIISFDSETTQYLLKKSGNVSGARIDELMLSSLANAVKDITGQTRTAIRLEGHGREKVSDIMIDRTVGWFTNAYSVVLDSGDDIYENIINAKEILRKASQWKLGCSFVSENALVPEISFNYLGEFSSGENIDSEYSSGQASAPENIGDKGISINGQIFDGQLYFDVSGTGGKFNEKLVKALAERFKANLEAEARYCSENIVNEKTASDYEVYDLSVDEFRKLKKSLGKEIEKIYSLTPLQEGMLFYNIENEESTSYVLQSVFKMNVEPNEEILKKALMLLSERYEVLKTAVIYNDIPRPKQVVYKERVPELSVIETNSSEEFSTYIQKDVEKGFRLDKDTLLRVTILRSPDKCSLIWTIHHIIIDGWCSDLLFKALMTYYGMISEGKPIDEIRAEIKAEKAVQGEYSDYIRWIESRNIEKAKVYWKDLLSGYENDTDIVPMKKPAATASQMERICGLLSAETTSKLMKMAEERQSTINTVAETACGILLQRYIGNDDVVFGKVVSGRNAEIKNIENIVGLFINTIPIRVVSTAETTVGELIENQQKQGLKSTEFDFCSLAEIQSMTLQGSELIKVLYAFENYASGTAEENDGKENGGGKKAFDVESSREQTNYGISISCHTENGRLAFEIMYDPSRYPSDEIDLLLDRLSNICVQMSESADKLVSSISEITDEEKGKILTEFNATETSYPKEKTIVELFEEQAAKTPDNTAVVFGSVSLTYSELNARANTIAYKLRESGIQPDDFAAIIADKGIEVICGIFGILKAGGAYVPIDPTYPQERISFIIKDCKPKEILLFTDENIVLPEDVPVIDLHNEEFYKGISENPTCVNKPSDLAYCIYTSGTTGQPKGSLIEQKSVVRLVRNTNYTELNEHTVILQTGSMSFDASTFEVWGTALNGGTLHLINKDLMLNAELFKNYMIVNHVNTLFITTALFNQFVNEDISIFDCLEHLMFGGEATSEKQVKALRSHNARLDFRNVYGPTETTTFATHYIIDKELEKTPIGRPISNTQTYILNGMKMCGVGIPGELCITGDGVARGYLNRPELTAEKFVKNPFGKGKMYRSGDLARWLPDGNIEYLGRIDEQVKIRGFRIELGEIESRLREIEGIKDCAVIARPNPMGEKAIYAYYVSDTEVSVTTVRDMLSQVIPSYMIPA